MWCNLPSPVPSRLSFSPLWITPLFYIAARPSPPSSPIPPHWPTFFSPGLFSQASAQHKAACTAQIWAGEKKKRKKKKWGNEWESGGKQEIRSKSGFSGTSPCCSWLLGGAESRSEAKKQNKTKKRVSYYWLEPPDLFVVSRYHHTPFTQSVWKWETRQEAVHLIYFAKDVNTVWSSWEGLPVLAMLTISSQSCCHQFRRKIKLCLCCRLQQRSVR